MEFLLVSFPEERHVYIDDVDTSITTGQIIEVEAGHHTISLGEPRDYTPEKHEVVLEDTNVLSPLEVSFEKK